MKSDIRLRERERLAPVMPCFGVSARHGPAPTGTARRRPARLGTVSH